MVHRVISVMCRLRLHGLSCTVRRYLVYERHWDAAIGGTADQFMPLLCWVLDSPLIIKVTSISHLYRDKTTFFSGLDGTSLGW